jgi:phage tail-like protein
MPRNDPLRNFRFEVDIDGIKAGFSDAAIAETTSDVTEYREGSDPTHVRKLSGLTKYGNITLKYGITTDSLKLYKWYKDVLDKGAADHRKKVTIVVKDEAGADKARFVVSEAWPMKYHSSDLNAKGNEVIIESLELANEGIERVA